MSSISPKIFGTLCDGEIEIRLLTKEYVEGAVQVLQNSFFFHENICIAADTALPESTDARKEMEVFGRGMITDGISLVARHIQTDKIVAVAVNTILYIPEPGQTTFIDELSKTCTTPNLKTIMRFLSQMDKEYDLFENWNIDCIFEIMFLSTLPEFGKKQIGRALCEYSIEFAKALNQGIGVEYLREDLKNKRPKAVSALFSSKFSQKIGDILGFETLKEVPFENFSHEGRTFAEKIDPIHNCCTVAGIKL